VPRRSSTAIVATTHRSGSYIASIVVATTLVPVVYSMTLHFILYYYQPSSSTSTSTSASTSTT